MLRIIAKIKYLQARYRQYFEAEENSSPSNESTLEDPIIPMETQVVDYCE